MVEIDRRSLLLGGGAVGALTLISVPAFGDEGHSSIGAWAPLSDMPFPVQEIYPAPYWSASALGDSLALKPTPYNVIVSAGGLTPGSAFNVTDSVVFYDPTQDTWGYGPNLPQPRHHIVLVNNNGYLYGIGGFARDADGGWQMRSQNWRLDGLNEGAWIEFQPLPAPQAECVGVSLGGFIHIVGGRSPVSTRNQQWSDHSDTGRHWTFDPVEDAWYPLAPMPTPRNSAAGAVVNGALYVIGGRTVSDGNSSAVDVYDPLSDRWLSARPLPKAQSGLSAAVMNGKIYVFGGEYLSPPPGGVFAEVWEYDPKRDSWRTAAAMPRPRHGHGAVSLRDGIYIFGGAGGVGGRQTTASLDRFQI